MSETPPPPALVSPPASPPAIVAEPVASFLDDAAVIDLTTDSDEFDDPDEVALVTGFSIEWQTSQRDARAARREQERERSGASKEAARPANGNSAAERDDLMGDALRLLEDLRARNRAFRASIESSAVVEAASNKDEAAVDSSSKRHRHSMLEDAPEAVKVEDATKDAADTLVSFSKAPKVNGVSDLDLGTLFTALELYARRGGRPPMIDRNGGNPLSAPINYDKVRRGVSVPEGLAIRAIGLIGPNDSRKAFSFRYANGRKGMTFQALCIREIYKNDTHVAMLYTKIMPGLSNHESNPPIVTVYLVYMPRRIQYVGNEPNYDYILKAENRDGDFKGAIASLVDEMASKTFGILPAFNDVGMAVYKEKLMKTLFPLDVDDYVGHKFLFMLDD